MKKLVATVAAAACLGAQAESPKIPPPIPVPDALLLPMQPPAAGLATFGAGIPVREFIRITVGEMAHKAYVISPNVPEGLRVSADLTRTKLKEPLPLVKAILGELELSVRDLPGGVVLIEKAGKKEEEKAAEESLVYKSSYRSIASLSTYFNAFPGLKFSHGSGIATKAMSPSSAAGGSTAEQAPVFDSGRVAFSANETDASAVLVRGTKEELERFKKVMAQLDTPVPEVLLRTYVLEVRTVREKETGVSVALAALGGKLGVELGEAGGRGDAITLKAGVASLAVSKMLNSGKVRLVSSPLLRAADGTTASSTIGTDTPTLGAIVTSQSGSAQQSVNYQSAGVLLSITPRVLEDSVRLSVSQEISSFVKTETGLEGTPTKLRRAFKSDLVAQPGEAVLLGGLSEQNSSNAESGSVWPFKRKSLSETGSEIVVLVEIEKVQR